MYFSASKSTKKKQMNLDVLQTNHRKTFKMREEHQINIKNMYKQIQKTVMRNNSPPPFLTSCAAH